MSRWPIRPIVGLLILTFAAGCSLRGEEPSSDPMPMEPEAPEANAPVDTIPPEPEGEPPLRVKISDEERTELLARAEGDLRTARTVSARKPSLTDLAPEERQKWESLDHYIQLAESFLEEGDARSAADLALKARLLAAELGAD